MNRWITQVVAGDAALAALGAVAPARAQNAAVCPNRPIHMIVPFAAGTADIVTRLVASCMPPFLGQPVVVENRGGAGGHEQPPLSTVAEVQIRCAILNTFNRLGMPDTVALA
jgi:tripartite-type tricarboxylate transporter receptor subunit TctC